MFIINAEKYHSFFLNHNVLDQNPFKMIKNNNMKRLANN